MIRTIILTLLLAACTRVELVKGCEAIADPIQYTNCKITGLTKK